MVEIIPAHPSLQPLMAAVPSSTSLSIYSFKLGIVLSDDIETRASFLPYFHNQTTTYLQGCPDSSRYMHGNYKRHITYQFTASSVETGRPVGLALYGRFRLWVEP
eukprot:3488711-Pleurochrysis_carterae.AAC.1